MRTLTRRWYLGLLPLIAACGITDVQAPALSFDEEVGEPFVEALDAATLQSLVQTGEVEVELFLLEDGATVGEIAVRTESLSADERIQSRIAALDEANEGRLTLDLASLAVTFHAGTRFWVGDDAVSRAQFYERVRTELSQGRHAAVVVEREAPTSAQGPTDARFVASDVVLGGDGTPSLRLKVDRDNLGGEDLGSVAGISGPSPDLWLRVLGHHVGLRFHDGTTHASRHRHNYPRVVGFEGNVVAVDLEARTVELQGGRTIRVTNRTDFVRGRGFVRSLRAASEALAQGRRVKARGLGVTQERDGRMLALRMALKVESAPEPVVVEFEGVVVDVVDGNGVPMLSLANGTTVKVRTTTELVAADDVSPSNLDELRDALADGREVFARGTGKLLQAEPRLLDGVRVVLEAEAPAPEEQFEVLTGVIDYVSFDGSVVLIDGTAVVVTNATQVVAGNSNSPTTIQELVATLDQNRRVEVGGEGVRDEAGQLVAVRLVLTALVVTFDVDVSMIDPDSGGLFLVDGSFALLTGSTVVTAVGNAPTDLVGIDAALAAGDRVRARGTGFVRGRSGPASNYEVIAVEFELMQ